MIEFETRGRLQPICRISPTTDRKIRYGATLMETALSLVRQGVAAAYLPRFIVGLHNTQMNERGKLVEIASRKLIAEKQPVYAVRRQEREEDRDFRLICKALRVL